MPITKEQLGARIRAAREACRMTQDDLAKHLGFSRPTVVQMEAGNRSVSSLELDKLAYLFGRDMREFVAESFEEEDTLAALFRAQPDVAEQPIVLDKLRECMALGRELTNLERLVGIDRDLRRWRPIRSRSLGRDGKRSSRASGWPRRNGGALAWAVPRLPTWRICSRRRAYEPPSSTSRKTSPA